MKKIILSCILLFIILNSNAQPVMNLHGNQKPKLIVGIVVDMMKYDYLTRYWNKFGSSGFRRLSEQGFNCSNANYNYVPTYTGPGHATIYTGTTPSVHGIVGNDWFDRKSGKNIYVTADSSVDGVGNENIQGASVKTGKMSPVNIITTTICDEVKIANNFRSKVIGIGLKDRGAILPAGHSANAAYWFDPSTGNWISSTYYMKELPGWLKTFNSKKIPDKYLQSEWSTLLPIEKYTESTADNNNYEDPFTGEVNPVFPHNLHAIRKGNYELIKETPFGNSLTTDLAVEVVKNESLGKDEFTDVLAVSFSSPDYIGHQFGTHAIETEDAYLRLDQEIARLTDSIEAFAGKGNVLFFLTADHGGNPNPLMLNDHKIPGKLFSISSLRDTLNRNLNNKHGKANWVLKIENNQVYLDHKLIEGKSEQIIQDATRFISEQDGIAISISSNDLQRNEYTRGLASLIQNGYNFKRSGDIVFHQEPGLVEYSAKGSNHGSGYTYDTHVPLIFYGWKIKTGLTTRNIDISAIAPTLSQLLGIQAPNGCTGEPVHELFK
jgi:predicted AlkP superfamily pyrophosphatase or phosphodiesterase